MTDVSATKSGSEASVTTLGSVSPTFHTTRAKHELAKEKYPSQVVGESFDRSHMPAFFILRTPQSVDRSFKFFLIQRNKVFETSEEVKA
jgi:hypothetical protein